MKKKIRLNVDLLGRKKGDVVSLDVDQAGNFIDKFWRRRFTDSAIDNCIEIVEPEPEPVTKSKKGKKS